ncbi:MAG: hypothetical protein ACNA7U_03815 [Candidatus Izemoplasmataceae bacterium]
MVKQYYIAHHGIKGQRWGVRRFQNDDGSLTTQGRKRYNVNEDGTTNMKDSYVRNERVKGAGKTAIGAAMITKGVIQAIPKGESPKDRSRSINKAILNISMGSIVISSGVKNFINTNKNRTFNSTGLGPTPENYMDKK